MSEQELWCPRREEAGAPGAFPGPDRWVERASMAGADPAAAPICSYCGALEPATFLRLVGEGWIVEPTDKNYKAYLAKPLSETELDERRQEFLRSRFAETVRAVELAAGRSEDDAAQVLDQRWKNEKSMWGKRRSGKLYFQHLSAEQCREFIDLYNTRRMRIGEPGYFYVRPYFCGVTGGG